MRISKAIESPTTTISTKRGMPLGLRMVMVLKYDKRLDQWYRKTGGVNTSWQPITHAEALGLVKETNNNH